MTDDDVIRAFPSYAGLGTPGFLTNFLGVRTRTSFASTIRQRDGEVEDYPIPGNFHATALEWAGCLRAVLDASSEFIALELGAGWAPWLVSLARAANVKGIHDVRLVGVEGSIDHVAYMKSHFVDNGLNPEQHTLLHAIVGLRDGSAEFPLLEDPATNWGAAAVFSERSGLAGWVASRPAARTLLGMLRSRSEGAVRNRRGTESVTSVSLRTLLRPFHAVDVLHVDIQGDEYKVLSAARQSLRDKVKRVIIGTHSRSIEQQLLDHLAAHSWVLEAEEPCTFEQAGPIVQLVRDGCQVWRNTAMLPTSFSTNGGSQPTR